MRGGINRLPRLKLVEITYLEFINQQRQEAVNMSSDLARPEDNRTRKKVIGKILGGRKEDDGNVIEEQMKRCAVFTAVSYTHLDVYKRQVYQ